MGGAAVVEPARGPMPVSPAEARSARLIGRKPTSYLAELGSPFGFECTTPHRTTPDTQPPGSPSSAVLCRPGQLAACDFFQLLWRISDPPASAISGPWIRSRVVI